MPPAAPERARLVRLLGIEALEDFQHRALAAVEDGRDVLVIAPTGSGKSAIFQLAAERLAGATIVVTPLLALHDDQLRRIDELDLSAAARLAGDTSAGDRDETLRALRDGALEYLFVTPETLLRLHADGELDEAPVSLVVVDEAHCVVTWGRGFRSAFAELGDVLSGHRDARVVALTASADPTMRDDIVAALGLRDEERIVLPLGRPEIQLDLVRHGDDVERRRAIVAEAASGSGRTLIYVPRRADTTDIAEQVTEAGRAARGYHGGMSASSRDEAATWFRDGDDACLVATHAFGMGVDIPDVRHVVHLDLPESLVSYYQEIGRAGRDGDDSTATAHVVAGTASRRAFAGGVRRISAGDARAVLGAIEAGADSRAAIARATGLSRARVNTGLAVLRRCRLVRPGRRLSLVGAPASDTAVDDAVQQMEHADRAAAAGIDRYLSTRTCRWVVILAALGEASEPCGRCDRCLDGNDGAGDGDGGGDGEEQTTDDDPMVGRRCHHPEFGDGTVVAATEDSLTVSFAHSGVKELDRTVALELLDVT